MAPRFTAAATVVATLPMPQMWSRRCATQRLGILRAAALVRYCFAETHCASATLVGTYSLEKPAFGQAIWLLALLFQCVAAV